MLATTMYDLKATGSHKRDKMEQKYELEDYIYDVESRSMETAASAAVTEPEDVYAQLQRKEKDLILAAELGKALLERNEELSMRNERLAEEYSQKLEEIEQDRHILRRKLLSTQSECDQRVLELQSDIRELQNALDDRENALRQTEKEKTLLITELTEQNQRLQVQLKESSRIEELLSTQLQGLRDQCNMKKSSLQDHQSSLEVLRDEINLMCEKKNEIERKLHSIQCDRDGLSGALEEAHDRIIILERQTREQEIQLRVNRRELDELRSVNSDLANRLEALGAGANFNHRSLYVEMECDDSSENLNDPATQLVQFKKELLSVHQRVRILCNQLRHRSRDTETSEINQQISNIHQVKVGTLTKAIQELCDVVTDFGSSDYSSSNVSVTELEIDLHRARETIDRLTKELEKKSEELKRKSETIMDLSSQLSVRESELSGVKEERDRARADLKDLGGMSRDEILRKAWEVRDGAVARKNATQVELARSRVEVMQASSQLYEAIQQKVELSQQVEQWQMDMQTLLDENVRKKLTNPDQSMSETDSPSSADKKRATRKSILGLFQR